MKSVFRFILCVLVFGVGVPSSQAAFSSLYVFGDSISSTTNGPGGEFYYNTNGMRWSNGRVWVEVLAQRQGLISDTNKNWSYYGHNSSNLVLHVNSFTASGLSNALVVVWVNNADFVDDMTYIYPSTNIVTWSNAISLSLSNHFKIVTNLYAKGVRTLIMPNAVDVMKIPEYNNTTDTGRKSFVRQRAIDFNAGLLTAANNAMNVSPGLKVFVPDIFLLLDNVLANAAAYGLTNTLYLGQSIDVIGDPNLANKALNGPGTNYIFWDYQAPTAKFHAVIADLVQQLISPPFIKDITSLSGTNSLTAANVPVGRNGIIEGSTNLVNWTTVQSFNSTNITQAIKVAAPEPQWFYRLRFPFAWSWP